MRHDRHETVKNPARKIIFACGLHRKVSLVSTWTFSDWNCSGLQKRRSRADLRCGSKRAFAITSFPGIRSFFFRECICMQSKCHVMKYYELRLGKASTKLWDGKLWAVDPGVEQWDHKTHRGSVQPLSPMHFTMISTKIGQLCIASAGDLWSSSRYWARYSRPGRYSTMQKEFKPPKSPSIST